VLIIHICIHTHNFAIFRLRVSGPFFATHSRLYANESNKNNNNNNNTQVEEKGDFLLFVCCCCRCCCYTRSCWIVDDDDEGEMRHKNYIQRVEWWIEEGFCFLFILLFSCRLTFYSIGILFLLLLLPFLVSYQKENIRACIYGKTESCVLLHVFSHTEIANRSSRKDTNLNFVQFDFSF